MGHANIEYGAVVVSSGKNHLVDVVRRQSLGLELLVLLFDLFKLCLALLSV